MQGVTTRKTNNDKEKLDNIKMYIFVIVKWVGFIWYGVVSTGSFHIPTPDSKIHVIKVIPHITLKTFNE